MTRVTNVFDFMTSCQLRFRFHSSLSRIWEAPSASHKRLWAQAPHLWPSPKPSLFTGYHPSGAGRCYRSSFRGPQTAATPMTAGVLILSRTQTPHPLMVPVPMSAGQDLRKERGTTGLGQGQSTPRSRSGAIRKGGILQGSSRHGVSSGPETYPEKCGDTTWPHKPCTWGHMSSLTR